MQVLVCPGKARYRRRVVPMTMMLSIKLSLVGQRWDWRHRSRYR